ncbi:hypothetical protein HMPREF1544_05332 [Mucor circinelloides 1006PhL]|uniref:Palmitoyltransferase n=1 Tax=Mucor circinelloides f. circinelloides (strain 1006PhL) TaxID=1220926 RepID=S2JYD4_MUCC1|nr:hypothetical protein HMPREF1544_05332 [Mucor circinelloides 1006PhL]
MAILEAIPEKLIVAFVTILITYLQTTANFYILGPALGGWTSFRAQKILLPMNVSLVSLYVNYYLACTTDPGNTPEGWEPPFSVLNPDEDAVIKVGITGPRFCKKCDAYKPPRAHHCKHCGKCVLRMDHHCPWIGNCVGFGNYSHFVRFVYSVIGCCTYGCYLLLWRLQRILDAWNNPWVIMKPGTSEVVMIVVDILLAGIVVLAVGVLAIYHTYCLFKGQTTIEGWERTKTKRLINRRKIDPVEFPFDVGFYKNICSVLGDNPLLWVWPSAPKGDGLKYTVKPDTDPLIPYSWPPRDPKDLGPSFIERIEQEQTTEGPKLVRRDSEGYLVREITMEDRMRMLNGETNDMEFDSGRDPIEQEAHEQFLREQQQVIDPEDYYYDSASVSDGFTDDEEEEEGQVNSEEWVDEE